MNDAWLCSKKIPWSAHKVNGTGNTLIFDVRGSVVCAHKVKTTKPEPDPSISLVLCKCGKTHKRG